MPTNSLCFREAYDARRSGQISLEEFITHIVAHYRGLRHEADAENQRPHLPRGFEVEVRKVVLDEDFQPLDDENVLAIQSMFLSAFHHDAAAVRQHIHTFKLSSDNYLRPLFRIAQNHSNAQLLRVCFENGFSVTKYIDSEDLLSSRICSNPGSAWLNVLFDHDFREWRSKPQQLSDWQTWRHVLYMGPDCTRWWIEHGGHTTTARGLFEYPKGWPGAATFQLLLDHFGIDWFTNSGTLQFAVKNRDFETVKMLVNAGADVNEEVTDWLNDVREYPAAPAPALFLAVMGKWEEMIWYLVENGARTTRRDLAIAAPNDIMPEEYRPYANMVVELGATEEETSS